MYKYTVGPYVYIVTTFEVFILSIIFLKNYVRYVVLYIFGVRGAYTF